MVVWNKCNGNACEAYTVEAPDQLGIKCMCVCVFFLLCFLVEGGENWVNNAV